MPEWRTPAQVPADHPCLAGHFPGHPVVPAVVLLEQVLAALHAWRGPQWRLRRLRAAKFLRPLLPDQPFDIVLHLPEPERDAVVSIQPERLRPVQVLAFRCERGADLLAQGTCELGP